ncbi:hypothetical protein PX699_16710 [Sphingobium sp. H39-3-25]|nr:hypothetical protein [Sphingobium arseniciresistens]
MLLLNEAFQFVFDRTLKLAAGTPSASLLAIFPPTEPEDPWSGFRSQFPDPDFPHLGADIRADRHDDAPDRYTIYIYGMTHFQPEPIANLIQGCCQASLKEAPIGFEWTETCSRPRPGEFGGGWCAIFPDRVEFETTREALTAALTGGII